MEPNRTMKANSAWRWASSTSSHGLGICHGLASIGGEALLGRNTAVKRIGWLNDLILCDAHHTTDIDPICRRPWRGLKRGCSGSGAAHPPCAFPLSAVQNIHPCSGTC
jgi:hypothetical protein